MPDQDDLDDILDLAETLARDLRQAFVEPARPDHWPSMMLRTSVRRIDVDIERHIASVFMPDGCCVDMTGCIYMVSLIDPNVTRISTFAGVERDTEYRLELDGEWRAYDPTGRARGSAEL